MTSGLDPEAVGGLDGPALGDLPRPVRIAARTSPLSRAQVELVGAAITALGAPWTFVGVSTRGDTDLRELTQIGGTGVFVTGVRQALLEDRADVAVHSLKDLPTAPHPELALVAVPGREDTRDVLVGRRLAELRDGDRVGTGSPRRADQLRDWAARHDRRIEVVGVRGNVDTRIGTVARGELDAVLLAAAGLARLGHLGPDPDRAADPLLISGLAAELLDPTVMVPAPGQGALGLECAHALDSRISMLLTRLDHGATRAEVLAERAFLRALEAGCTAPVGARATVDERSADRDLTMDAMVGTTWTDDRHGALSAGAELLRLSTSGRSADAERIGVELASTALARLS